MHEEEIIIFTDSIRLAQDKFYVDAIHNFNELIEKFPTSDLADDAMFNVGLCYFEMSQFQKCIDIIDELIKNYPDSTISALESGNEYGKTAAKGLYLIVQCLLGLNKPEEAVNYLEKIKHFKDSYIKQDKKEYSFYELADIAIKTYNKIL